MATEQNISDGTTICKLDSEKKQNKNATFETSSIRISVQHMLSVVVDSRFINGLICSNPFSFQDETIDHAYLGVVIA